MVLTENFGGMLFYVFLIFLNRRLQIWQRFQKIVLSHRTTNLTNVLVHFSIRSSHALFKIKNSDVHQPS